MKELKKLLLEALKDEEFRQILKEALKLEENNSNTFNSLEDLDLARRRPRVQIPAGPILLTFSKSIIEEFDKFLKEIGLRDKTRSTYRSRIKKLLEDLNYELTVEKLKRFVKKLMLTSSYQTVLGYRKALNKFAEFLRRKKGINIDFDFIFRDLGIKWSITSKIKYRDVSDEDMIKAYKILKKNGLELEATLFAFATVTGMRRSEILQLEKEHIDLDDRIVLGGIFDDKFIRKTKKFFFTFFTEEVREMIRPLIENSKSSRIFLISERRIKLMHKIIREKLGKNITLQTCREFFATKLLESGIFTETEVNILQGRIRGIIEKHYFIANWKKLRKKYDEAWKNFSFT